MNALVLNMVLAGVWAALVGQVDTASVSVGFALGYGVLWILRPIIGGEYHRKLPMFLSFVLFFMQELVISTLRVAWEVVHPLGRRRPGVVAVPLDAKSDVEIAVLANLITLTPGTLSLDVATDRSCLYVHAMFVDDPAAVRQAIKQGFERRVLALLRREES